MRIDEISKGGAVEVEVKYSGKTMSFKSDVIDIKNNSILITPITVNEQTIGFSDDCYINIYYLSEGKLFIWENATVKLIKYDGIVYHMIDLAENGKPFNRRNAYRLYVGEDMPLFVNSANGPNALSVLIKDISQTGVGFITKEDIDVDRTVRLKLKDNNTIIHLSGVVVRKEYLERLGSFHYGCRFNEKNHALNRYIAIRQSELLKKKNGNTPTPLVKPKGNNKSDDKVHNNSSKKHK